MKKIRTILLAALTATAISAGAAAIAGCTSSDSGEFTIDSVSGLASSYAVGDVIDATQIKFTCTDAGGNEVVKSYTDVTIQAVGEYNFGDTDEEGVYSFTATYDGVTYNFSYYVSAVTLTLDFNGGAYNGRATQEINCDVSGADISIIFTDMIEAAEDGYAFAGWFYDKEGTSRVEVIDNVVDIDGNTTIYACYDKDWSDLYNYEIADGCVTLTSAKIKGFYQAGGTQFVIPATVELYPVTAIGDNLVERGADFYDTYTELVFEEGSGVETIGDEAFASMHFEKITFPESLKRIGEGAFANNFYLTGTLTLSKNLTTIGANAFSSASIEAIDAVEGCALTEIGERAFIYCSSLTSVTLPEGLTTIGKNVFDSCSGITTINIPASVTNIALGAFASMSNLTTITVAEGNTNYTVLNGDLYRIDGDNLSLYRFCYGYGGGRKSYTPLSGDKTITSISEGAFSLDYDTDEVSLKNIYMSGVTSIGESAFENCEAKVWISDTVTNIAAGAFSGYCGDAIRLGNNNATTTKAATDYFSVDDDGVLYTADKKELVCILKNYSKEKYTLPASVEIIRSGAVVRNDNIYIFEIPAGSALTTIKASGIQIGSMNSLCGIYCYKETPFALAESAFDSDNSFGSPYVYVTESAYSAYAAAWANYVGYVSSYGYTGQTEKEKIGVSDILSSAETHAAALISDIENAGYTSYALFNKGVSGKPTYDYSTNGTAYYNVFRQALSVCIMLDTGSEYADYIYSYAATYIKLAEAYYSYSYINTLISVWNSYTDADKNAAAKLDDYIAEVESYKNGTAVTEKPEIAALNEYFSAYTYDADTFSATDFKQYYDKMHSDDAISLGMYYALSNTNAVNYMKGEASYLISQLKALGTITVNNFRQAYQLCYGDNESSAGIYGLTYQLCWYYSAIEYDYNMWDMVCDDTIIAGYSDYLTIKDGLFGTVYDSFIADAVDYVDSFEITSTYDEEKYNEFIDLYYFMYYSTNMNTYSGMLYDWISGMETEGISAKYNAMISSYNIWWFFNVCLVEANGYSDAEIDEESKAIYQIIHTKGIEYLGYDHPDGFSIDDVTEYESRIIDLEKFDAKYEELQKKYDDAVAALKAKLDGFIVDGEFNYDGLTAETYAEITALAEAAQTHIDVLYAEDYSYYEYLTCIELWNKLQALKAAYPDPTAVTDYEGLYELLYSYYDVDKGEYNTGLDYYYDTLFLTYGKETFESYAAVFATETAADEEA